MLVKIKADLPQIILIQQETFALAKVFCLSVLTVFIESFCWAGEKSLNYILGILLKKNIFICTCRYLCAWLCASVPIFLHGLM